MENKPLKIIDLTADNQHAINQAAHLLVIGFQGYAWPDAESGLEEVQDLLTQEAQQFI